MKRLPSNLFLDPDLWLLRDAGGDFDLDYEDSLLLSSLPAYLLLFLGVRPPARVVSFPSTVCS